jgi:hypothetical protein
MNPSAPARRSGSPPVDCELAVVHEQPLLLVLAEPPVPA